MSRLAYLKDNQLAAPALLTALAPLQSVVPRVTEIKAGVSFTTTFSNSTGTYPDVKAGDTLFLFMASDNDRNRVEVGGEWSNIWDFFQNVDAQVWYRTATTDEGDVAYNFTNQDSGRECYAGLIVSHVDPTSRGTVNQFNSSGTAYTFNSLARPAGTQLFICVGFLDDDLVSTLAPDFNGYQGYAGAQAFQNGSSVHVYAKIVEGDAGTDPTTVGVSNGGSDSWQTVKFQIPSSLN